MLISAYSTACYGTISCGSSDQLTISSHPIGPHHALVQTS